MNIFACLRKVKNPSGVDNKYSETVIDALIKQAHKLPRELYKSLTKWGAKKNAPRFDDSPSGRGMGCHAIKPQV